MNLANLPIPHRLRPFFTPRFIKFGLVGASGVVVNLGALWLGLRLGLRSTAASALAIQLSILSNFAVNELWTFAELRPGTRLGRIVRFQLVSLVGAAVQFGVFVGANLAALRWQGGPGSLAAYFAQAQPGVLGWLQHPVLDPPDVGLWVYVSQLVGIGVATAWNFLANMKWTWGER
ncbi:MAG: GtrA family protein [Myxococcales bacterium]|nr:GtrA family protein [Myxococcales bacterium]